MINLRRVHEELFLATERSLLTCWYYLQHNIFKFRTTGGTAVRSSSKHIIQAYNEHCLLYFTPSVIDYLPSLLSTRPLHNNIPSTGQIKIAKNYQYQFPHTVYTPWGCILCRAGSLRLHNIEYLCIITHVTEILNKWTQFVLILHHEFSKPDFLFFFCDIHT